MPATTKARPRPMTRHRDVGTCDRCGQVVRRIDATLQDRRDGTSHLRPRRRPGMAAVPGARRLAG